MHLPVLIPVTLLLILAALVGVLQAAAKDHVTTTEGVIFWLSLAALPFLLLALVTLLGVRIWRVARHSASKRKAAGLAS